MTPEELFEAADGENLSSHQRAVIRQMAARLSAAEAELEARATAELIDFDADVAELENEKGWV